jgi:hypothetical protein
MGRRLQSLAALALVAVIGLGCSSVSASNSARAGGTTAAPASTGSTDSNREQAMKFADCMRKNGIREFPDPDASGSLSIERVVNGSSLQTDTPAFRQANSACKELEPAGFTGTRRTPEQQAASLKFAQCVRDNGIKDFPDPLPDGPIIDTNRMPGSPGALEIPGFNAALRKCDSYAGEMGIKRP